MSVLFSELTLPSPRGGLTLPNRLVVAPMCQYQAREGLATDWHQMHWANLFNSGASLVTLEATAVQPQGRITPACLGLWDDATAAALGEHLARARALAPPVAVCIQLAHAGRKAACAVPWEGGRRLPQTAGGWLPQGPTAQPFNPEDDPVQALDAQGLAQVREAFVAAARRAQALGIEAVELHAAHGYLLHQFLSPLSNDRPDGYGGALEQRLRFVLEVFAAVRAVFDGVLGLRLSAHDGVPGGWDLAQSIVLAQRLRALGCDFIHVSSGGLDLRQQITPAPLYQVPAAQALREASGLVTTAVGLITEPQQAEQVLASGAADLVALARGVLWQPRWGWQAAAALGGTVDVHPSYARCSPVSGPAIWARLRAGPA